MRKTGRVPAWIQTLLLAASMIAGPAQLARADAAISASVDRNSVPLNESVRLNVTLSGSASMPNPEAPDLSAFSAYSAGRSQSISIVNGRMSSSVIYTYILTPKSVGHFVIGPFSVTVDGKTVRTDPIPLDVTAAAAQAPAASPGPAAPSRQAPGAFVQMFADRNRA